MDTGDYPLGYEVHGIGITCANMKCYSERQ